ncbi:MAG: tetratricopeptide repeat protein [Gemmatimonadetes bacterium]|nr:tetratricopeptide repeat protein [Gemmatimonadota bacterium]
MARTRRRISRREMKEDRFILWLYEMSSEIDRHWKSLTAAVVLVVACVVGWYYWTNMQADDLVEAGQVFAPGQTAMQDSRYEDAIPIFERVVTEFGGTAVALEATIELANACFQTGDIEKARTYYQTYLDEYGRQDVHFWLAARSGLAACDEEEEKYEEAANQYLALADEDPDSYLAPGLLLNAARCFGAADQKDQARALYDRVVENYEETPYARDARIALTAL